MDYHFRGEQDILEKNHPALKKKAIKYLGASFYYDLSPFTGAPIPQSDTMYTKLMGKYQRLEAQIEKDLVVKKEK